MVGEVCRNIGCERKIFPPRDICPYCNKPANIEYKFSGRGEVYSFTTVYDAPKGFEKYVPYVVALVKLEEGPMVTAQLTDLEQIWTKKEVDGEMRDIMNFNVQIGMPVEMVTRIRSEDGDRGIIDYGYKFRPPIRVDLQSGLIFKAQEAEVPAAY